MKDQKRTFLLSLAGAGTLIAIAVVLVLSGPGRPWAFPKPGTKIPGQLPVAEQPQQPVSMSWNPDSLVITLSPGETKAAGATARFWNTNTPPPVLQVPPALASFVTVIRDSVIGTDASGKWIEFDFKVLVTVASGTPFQILNGSLTGSGVRQLPVKLNIWQGIEAEGVSFAIPPSLSDSASIGSPVVTSQGNGVSFVQVPLSIHSGDFLPAIGIAIWPNPDRLSLREWFGRQVDDSSGSLQKAGTYSSERCPDGKEVLVLHGLVPDSYLEGGGLVSLPYAFSSENSTTITSITLAQDSDLNLLTMTPAEREQLLLEILCSIELGIPH